MRMWARSLTLPAPLQVCAVVSPEPRYARDLPSPEARLVAAYETAANEDPVKAKANGAAAGIAARLRPVIVRYAIAVLAMGFATGISLFIHQVLGEHPGVQIVFWIALLASAWWGGYGPGVLASILVVYVIPYAFDVRFHPTNTDITRLVLLSGLSLMVSYIADRRRQAEMALRLANEMLEERVQQRTAELERSNAGLRTVNEALNQFAYSASHDLQEPLRMLTIYSQMFQHKYKGQLDERADEYIRYMVEGAKRMEALLSSLLSYTQVINIAPGESRAVDANAVLANALSNLSAAIEESGAEFICNPLPPVRMQEIHLLQLFQNLIGNAIKYRGKEPPRIEISASKRGRECTICVSDNGIGIPPEYADQIFQMFKRLHSPTEYAGTGVGLALCRRIVEHYGGRIWVESEEGKGAKFYFTAPAEERFQTAKR